MSGGEFYTQQKENLREIFHLVAMVERDYPGNEPHLATRRFSCPGNK